MRAIALNMTMLNRALTPVDPSNFLKALQLTVKNQDILTLSPSSSVQLSVSIFLASENLENENKWFCPQCSLHQESTKETRITRNSEILTLHLKKFARDREHLVKDNKYVESFSSSNPYLNIPISSDSDTSFIQKYALVAVINHSGTLNAGHYWAHIKDRSTNSWYLCNDKAMSKFDPRALNSTTSCFLLSPLLVFFGLFFFLFINAFAVALNLYYQGHGEENVNPSGFVLPQLVHTSQFTVNPRG
ncbi:uncharacterized protein LOC130630134 [Hydractinia symbiolongicarpus]|uniref:uncharacterized protein LOC130630134 n=1 Tax=Hydractinia symbiolongicarpus TaxID=13093 RepID=UPI00254EB4D2|nr:uncharacterized protein LOC130630134 [Hydractinia symbiolongicarpus]